jgi:benzil reductase ((S)-benzoin forming)
MLGNVQRISDQSESDLSTVLAVNTVAPAILMNTLSRTCGDKHELTVVNISSGAAKRAIPSWAAYCASKAALEMISETFCLEEREKGRSTKVYAVAPGVVDTAMQATIRSVDPKDFAASATFHAYKENDELVSAEMVAEKLSKLLELPWSGKVSFSLRDIELRGRNNSFGRSV